LSGIVAKFCL